jgi:hypothetical protein
VTFFPFKKVANVLKTSVLNIVSWYNPSNVTFSSFDNVASWPDAIRTTANDLTVFEKRVQLHSYLTTTWKMLQIAVGVRKTLYNKSFLRDDAKLNKKEIAIFLYMYFFE